MSEKTGNEVCPSLIISPLEYGGNMVPKWKRFKVRFMNYLEAFMPKASKKRKVALLLHFMGDDGFELLSSFNLNQDEQEDIELVLEKFDSFFLPKLNVTYERFLFFTRRQKENESFEQFMVALKNLSSSCEFGQLNEELVRDIFVSGIEDSALRESLLRIENLTIDSALKHCQAKELAVRRNEKIKPQMDVAELQNNKGVLKDMVRTGRVCRQCGYQHTHGKCPARGKTCNNCKKMGHFGKMCRNVHEIDIGNDSASTGKQVIDEVRDSYLKIDSISVGSNAVWKEYLTINDVNIEFKIDSGHNVM